jgi:hypothetical protein
MVTAQHEGLNKIATLNLEYTREMLRALFDLPVPKEGAARLASPDRSEADPGVCRADNAILYGTGEERFGVIVETQRDQDDDKLYAWLEYIANFRARERCPACLVVICPTRKAARWAAREIHTGHPGLILKALIIHAGNTPVITDLAQATENIGLAIISAITQSEHPKFATIFAVLQQALDHIDTEQAWRYARYVNLSLLGDAQEEWNRGMSTMTYPYQGEYVEGLLAEGKIRGLAEGKIQGEIARAARAVIEVLEVRGLVVSEAVRQRVTACEDLGVLDQWHIRAITAESVEDVFG